MSSQDAEKVEGFSLSTRISRPIWELKVVRKPTNITAYSYCTSVQFTDNADSIARVRSSSGAIYCYSNVGERRLDQFDMVQVWKLFELQNPLTP